MDHRRYVAIETGVSVVVNGVVTALFTFLLFSDRVRIGLWGGHGLALDLVPMTFMNTFMTAIGLTLITRWRVRRGIVAAAPKPPAWLPVRLFRRAVLLAILATATAAPLAIGALALLWRYDWSYGEVLAFKLALSTVLALAVSPLLAREALGDSPRVVKLG